MNLGSTLYQKRDFDGAIAEFREGLRLNPHDAQAHANLGNALRAKGDLDGAIACLRTGRASGSQGCRPSVLAGRLPD